MYQKCLRFLAVSFFALGLCFILPAPSASAKLLTESNLVCHDASHRYVINISRDEIEMMEYVVEKEVGGLDIQDKRVIADVIVNRVLAPEFPDTVYQVLTQKKQFPTVSNYYERTRIPTSETKQAVREVLLGKYRGVSQGAKYFYAPRWCSASAASWFENCLTFLFEHDGQRFFK